MADPYDEFKAGGGAASAATPAPTADPYDEFQRVKAAPSTSPGLGGTALDVVRGGLSGLTTGGAQLVGLPVDAAAGALRLARVPVGAEPPGGSASLERGLRAVGAIQTPETAAGRFAERTMQDVGAAGVGAVTGVGAARLFTGVGGKLGAALQQLAALDPKQILRAEALLGTISGAGAAAARAITGAKDSALVDLVGSITSMAGVTGAKAFIKFAASTARGLGLSTKMAEREVGKSLAEAVPEGSTFEANLKRSIAMNEARGEGALPMTTSAAAGAPPMLERETARAAASPVVGSALQSERAQSSAQLLREASGVAPATGTMTEAQQTLTAKLMAEAQEKAQVQAVELGQAMQRHQDALTVLLSRTDGLRQAAQREVQEVVTQLGPTANRAIASDAILDIIKKREVDLRQAAGELFDRVDGSLVLSTDRLNATVSTVVAEAQQGLRLSEELPKTVKRLAEKLQPGDGQIINEATFGEVRKWRSHLLNEMRQEAGAMAPDREKLRALNRTVEAVERTLDQAGQSSTDYRVASMAYKDFVQRFRQGVTADVLQRGPRGEVSRRPVESVVQEFFQGGKGALTRAKAFIAAVGDRPQAGEALKRYAIGDFLDVAVEGNKTLSPTRAAAWAKKHREALGVFPEVRAAVDQVTEVLKQAETKGGLADWIERSARKGEVPSVANAAQFLARTAEQAEESAVKFFLDADASQAVAGLLRKPNAVQLARTIRQSVESDATALNGLRRGLVDEMLGQIVEREADRAGRAPLLNADRMRHFLDEHEGVFRALYPDAAYDHLRKVQAIAEVVLSPQAQTSPTGVLRAVSSSTLFTVDQLLSRAYGIERGVIGTRFVASDLAARAITQLMQSVGQARMQRVLDRALFDPKAAELLLDTGRTILKRDAARTLTPKYYLYLANLGGPPLRGRERE